MTRELQGIVMIAIPSGSMLAANDYDPSKIKKPCETDCSQSTASIVKAVGTV